MKKKIYVSIPITGKDLLHVKAVISVIGGELTRRGWKVVTPFDKGWKAGMPYNKYIGRDITMMLDCDAVYFCAGWQDSKGCIDEFEVAKNHNKQILFDKCV